MPTKLNKAGQQQPYVPAGNGDASGEYGDHATGSNRHFTNFGKKEETPTEIKQAEQPKQEEIKKSEEKQRFIENFDKHTERLDKELKEKCKSIIDNANDEALKIINDSFSIKAPEYITVEASSSYYRSATNEINIKPEQFSKGYSNEGSVVFHETAHQINDTRRINEKELGWYDRLKMLSEAKSLHEDGKSMRETLQEELKSFSLNKNPEKIRKEKVKYINEKLNGKGFKYADYISVKNEAQKAKDSAEWQAIKSSIVNKYNNGVLSISEANEQLKKRYDEWQQNGTYKEVFSKFKKMREIAKPLENEWIKESGIEAVSDAWSSKSDYGFGVGHNRSYYSKSGSYGWNDGEENLGDEFFANLFGAWATGNEKVLECTKSYLPQSYAKFEKIINRLKGVK